MLLLDFVKFYPVVLIHENILLNSVGYVHLTCSRLYGIKTCVFSFLDRKERSYLVCLSKAEKYSLICVKLVLLITMSQKKYLKAHTSRELLTSSTGVTAEKPEASIWDANYPGDLKGK